MVLDTSFFISYNDLCNSVYAWLNDSSGEWILCSDAPPPPPMSPPDRPGENSEEIFVYKHYTVKFSIYGEPTEVVVPGSIRIS